MTRKQFISFVRTTCKQHGIKFIVTKTERLIEGGAPFSGWFDEKSITIAGKLEPKIFLEILVHEFAHAMQYLDKDPVWKRAQRSDFDTWWARKRGCKLKGKRLHQAYLDDVLVEWDAERRVLEMIKLFDLPIDPVYYAKAGNAYILSYGWVLQHRSWYDKAPYRYAAILDAMPSKLVSKDELEPSKKMISLFNKYLKES